MGGRGGSGRGRVRVRGGRSSMGRGLSGFVDQNQFGGLDSDDNGDNVYVDNKKVRQDKKRQRVSTNSSDDFYQNVDESDMEDSDCDDDDNDDNDFMRLTMDKKLTAMFTKISATEVKVNSIYKEKLSRRVQKVENMISAHEQRIKLLELEYRSIDSEARSRRLGLCISPFTTILTLTLVKKSKD